MGGIVGFATVSSRAKEDTRPCIHLGGCAVAGRTRPGMRGRETDNASHRPGFLLDTPENGLSCQHVVIVRYESFTKYVRF